jgi:hypothetical protein
MPASAAVWKNVRSRSRAASRPPLEELHREILVVVCHFDPGEAPTLIRFGTGIRPADPFRHSPPRDSPRQGPGDVDDAPPPDGHLEK